MKLFHTFITIPPLSIKRHYYYKIELSKVGRGYNDQVVFNEIFWENVDDIRFWREELLDTFRDFLGKGYLGLYGYIDNHLVAYAWCVLNESNKTILLRNFFRLPANSAYIYYCRVDSLYQGQKIYQTMLRKLYKQITSKSLHIYLDTQIDNVPAQYAIEKSGGILQGIIIRVLFWGRDWFTYKILKS